ncbi:lipase secretion chaperone [Gynuella sp.]|uniref:lipase secretion chaperone n=1 Tax=Gynuella sp. TaxID=2969146 RepID=UPI003D0A675A
MALSKNKNRKHNIFSNRRSIYGIAIGICILGLAFGIYNNDKKTKKSEASQRIEAPVKDNVQPKIEQNSLLAGNSSLQNSEHPVENISPEPPNNKVASLLKDIPKDKQGNIVVNGYLLRSLNQLYDTLPHSEDMTECSKWIENSLASLEDPAKAQTSEILNAYCNYRTALLISALDSQKAENSSSATSLNDQIFELRHQYFAPDVINKLFAEEEIQSRYMLAAMNTLNDPSLNGDEQKIRLQELQERFNSDISEIDSPLADIQRAYEVEKLREQGASESEIFSYRSRSMGADFAIEKSEEDLKIRELTSRYNYFLEQRQQIENSGLDSNDANEQISTLLKTMFTPEELQLLHTSHFEQLEN